MSKKSTGSGTAARIKREVAALKKMPESEIDTSDLPVLPPEKWKNAVVGRFYRPIKKPVALRLDADLIAWLKSKGPGYQSRINEILRERMAAERKRA